MTTNSPAALTNPYREALNSELLGRSNKWFIEHITTILNALTLAAELPNPYHWNPISTAPKDGTWILGYWPTMKIDDHPCAIYYESGLYLNPDAWSTVRVTDHGQEEVYPTNWAHLINVPKIEE